MKPENEWLRKWFTREMPLEEDLPLTASFELYDNDVIGIHLHNCFSDGMLDETALQIINRFGSRTEYDEERSGVYILVRGELPYFDGYMGLPIKAYYLTLETIVYEKIVKNQDAIDWLMSEYPFFLAERPEDHVSERYYRQVSYEDGKVKVSTPEIKQGSRRKTLLSYGGRLLSEGYSMDHVEVKMYDFNMLYCVPPLQYSEFEGIVKSVKKYSQERDGENGEA